MITCEKRLAPPASPFVNLMIIGVQKAGTTALAHFLSQHPEICMSTRKEVHVFDDENTHSLTPSEIDKLYEPFFPHYRGQRYVAEATPVYLYLAAACRKLREYNPALRLIVLLRDPVERALSHYAMERSRGNDPWPLFLAISLESLRMSVARMKGTRGSFARVIAYQDRGRYRRQLRTLFDLFPTEQILLLKSEALRGCHEKELRKAYRFLELSAGMALPKHELVFSSPARIEVDRFTRRLLEFRLRKERDYYESLFAEAD